MLRSRRRYLIVLGFLWFFLASLTNAATVDQSFLTSEEQNWLRTHASEFVVAPEGNYPPFSFTDAGVWKGMSADVIKLIEGRLGIKLPVLPAQNLNTILNHARQGGAGIITSVKKTPDRAEFLDFTQPYGSVPTIIIVKSDFKGERWPEAFEAGVVAVGRGYGVQKYLERIYPNIKLALVTDDLQGLRLVSLGKVDAVVMDAASATFFIEKEKITNLRVLSAFDYTYDLSFAVRKDLPVLRDILAKTLQVIPQQEKQAITNKWHFNLDSPLFQPDKYQRFWPVVLSVLLIIIISKAWIRRAAENKSTVLHKIMTYFEMPTAYHLNLLPALFVAMITIMLLSLLWQDVNQRYDKHLHDSFVAETERVTIKINERMLAYGEILHASAGLFAGFDSVGRSEWKNFVEKLELNQEYRGIQGVGFSLLIPKKKLNDHIRKIRTEGFPYYNVKPSGEREVYTSIIYLEPFSQRNLRAIGYDMFSEPVRHEAMYRAVDTGDLALSGKVKLLQESNANIQPGLLAFYPVYKNGVIIQSREQRHAALIGWVYSPYRTYDLLMPVLADELTSVRLEIFDEGIPSPDTLLFDTQSANFKQARFAKEFALSNIRRIEVGGRYWTLRYTAIPGYAESSKIVPPWNELTGLIVIGVLVFGLTLAFINTRRRVVIAHELANSLQESERRWKFALEGAGDGVWDWDITAGEITFSRRWYEIQGFEEGAIGPAVSAWMELLHPDDLPVAEKLLQEHFSGKTPNFSCEHRVRCKNGEYKWVLDRGMVVVRDSDGNPLRAIGTHSDITERKLMEEQIRQLAFYDSLTRLPNRRLLNDRLSQIMSASRRSGLYGALIFLDLDNFKSLNDTSGHDAGDLLLIEVAERLKKCVRSMDSVARFGGDEFVVLLSELDGDKIESTAQAGHIAEKIRAALSDLYFLPVSSEAAGVMHRCTASIGVAVFIDHEASQDDILKWADAAMYRAKEFGRNQIRFHA